MISRLAATGLFPLCLAMLAPQSRADFITGVVVDQFGVGVAGVNLDIVDPTGTVTPTVLNGGTAPDGSYTTEVTPPGIYDVIFKPPVPPTTTHLVTKVAGVNIVGTVAMGTVALPPGVAAYGRVLDPTGLPLAGVDLDVVDESTGEKLIVPGDQTDSLGQFGIAVPAGPIELRFDPAPVSQSIAPTSFELAPTADVQLGDVLLEVGYLVTAIVRGPGGLPVENADFDAHDSITGEKLYTPGDNTNGTGFADFVVPAGTYDIDLAPPAGAGLVAWWQPDTVVAGNMSLGLINLQMGVTLSGVVVSYQGARVAGVDIDLNDSATGTKIPLYSDNTDANGFYSVIVPTGTFRVSAAPPFSEPLGLDTHDRVVVTGNTSLNAILPSCPFYTNSGTGSAGSGGVTPQLIAVGGTPRLTNPDYSLRIANGLGGAQALIMVKVAVARGGRVAPWSGPWITAFPSIHLMKLSGPAGVPGVGAGTLPLPIPKDPLLIGLSIFANGRVIDPQGSGGVARTPDLDALLCP